MRASDPMTHARVRQRTIDRLKAWMARCMEARERAAYRPWWQGDEPTQSEAIDELLARVERHDARGKKRRGKAGR